MHAVELLHESSAQALGHVHSYRRDAVWSGVSALLRGRQLWLTALGRNVGGEVSEKHSIKRMDRLLGNPHLGAERVSWYHWLAQRLLGGCREPVILVDWSDLDSHKGLFVLRAALAVGGRALPVYEQVHDSYGDTRWHRQFLSHLAQVLGAQCTPILVTDAGFRPWWFKLVAERGWSYVGRVRNRELLCWPGDEEWWPNKALHAQASARPKALGEVSLSKSHALATQLYLYRGKPKKRQKLNRFGTQAKGPREAKYAAAAREPWLLVSNLTGASARHIVNTYRLRMQIEEGFRDLKAPRNGFAFRQNMGRNAERVANLLLLGALAMLVTWLVGIVGNLKGLQRGLQANTVRTRRVLSVFTVGSRLLAQGLAITRSELRLALSELQRLGVEQGRLAE